MAVQRAASRRRARRAKPTRAGRPGFTYSATYGGAQLAGEPYTVAPGSDFSWFRSRILGGRTNHYGRVTLRFADYDFKPRSRDGLGFDWPISYEDLAPYYDKAEAVHRRHRHRRKHPQRARRHLRQPAPLRAHDMLVQRSCAKLDIRAVAGAAGGHDLADETAAPGCHYCGQCGRGCMTASNYASSYVQIFPAMKTGRVQVVANAMARELITDATGKVTAVSYIDKTDGTEKQVRCRTVVLAASACESARLLLNSKSSRHPQGLANSSGMVGRYLMDTVGSSMSATVPALSGMPHYNSDGYGGASLRAVVGLGQSAEAGLPARLSHRSRRRLRHAGHRLVHRHRQPHRRLRREDEAGDPRRIRHHDRLRRAAAR